MFNSIGYDAYLYSLVDEEYDDDEYSYEDYLDDKANDDYKEWCEEGKPER